MSSYMRKTNMVEGFGDELIYGIGAFFGILIPLVAFVFTRLHTFNFSRMPGCSVSTLYSTRLLECLSCQLKTFSSGMGLLFCCLLHPTDGGNESQEIHPDSADIVQTAREHVQHPNRNSNNQTQQENTGKVTCPVCLADAQFAAETNCGHLFCGNCIIAYWQHGHWLGAVHCPVCRSQVTLLMVNFTEEEDSASSPEKQNILLHINAYNRRFSGEPRPWMDYIRDLPTLLRHAGSEFFSVGGLVWMFRLRVVLCFMAAFLYFISPLDLIPEAVFGILGLLDDLFILLLLAIYITIIYRQYLQNRADT